MSTEIVNYEELLSSMAQEATKSERPSVSNIGLRAGMLSYGGQPVPGNKLDCIVIASTHANLFYEGKFDPNNMTNPVCYAYSLNGEDMHPHASSSAPQAEDCGVCPHNQWGSDPSGGRGKACKNSRHLALVPASVTAEEMPTAEVAVLKLPVMSITNWSNYVNKVATLFRMPPLGIVTTIGTQPDAKSQFRVTFANGDPVDKSLLPALIERKASAEALLERTYDANQEAPEAPAEKAGKKKF